MKAIRSFSYVLLLLGFCLFARPVSADGEIVVVDGTTPISAELRTALNIYLNSNPPLPGLQFYAVTSFKDEGTDYLVSLAGLDLASAEDTWSMEALDNGPASKVRWIGSIRLNSDGTGEPYSIDPPPAGYIAKLAMPRLPAAGGGAYVWFPFQNGRSLQYGVRRIHGSGDYGTSGMYAVDLVGGDGLGTNVANSTVFASDTGTIDYVCDDNTSVAIRTHNNSTGDYFIYAHLLNNANLQEGHTFSKGSAIGALKYGSFNDTCGWADQGPTNYHVHWMFTPANNAFRVEDCTLDFGDKKFHCSGNKVIGSGGWLINAAGGGSGSDDPFSGTSGSAGGYAPSIWDNIITAAGNVASWFMGKLPDHNSPGIFLRSVFNTITLAFRLGWIILRGNLNLAPIFLLMAVVIAERILFAIPYIIVWLIKVWRMLKQAFWPI